MGGIFINYRRDDSAPWAGRLFERLAREFPRNQLLMDVDAIEPGLDFVQVLDEQVSGCTVLLAIIGPNWTDSRNRKGVRRLDNPDDFVRIELSSALKRNVRVIPVLIDGARMPREEDLPEPLKSLARRNAVQVSHVRFGADTQGLVDVLHRLMAPPPRTGLFGRFSRARKDETPSRREHKSTTAADPPPRQRREPEPSANAASLLSDAPPSTAGQRESTQSAPAVGNAGRNDIRSVVIAAIFTVVSTPLVQAIAYEFNSANINWFGTPQGGRDSGYVCGSILITVLALLLGRIAGGTTSVSTALYWMGMFRNAFYALALLLNSALGYGAGLAVGGLTVIVSGWWMARRIREPDSTASTALYWLYATNLQTGWIVYAFSVNRWNWFGYTQAGAGASARIVGMLLLAVSALLLFRLYRLRRGTMAADLCWLFPAFAIANYLPYQFDVLGLGGSAGAVAGIILFLTVSGLLVYRRERALTSVEMAIYWVLFSIAVETSMVNLMAGQNNGSSLTAVTAGWLIGGAVSVLCGIGLLIRRRRLV